MNAHDLNTILQIGCITLLSVVCILLIKYARAGLNTWAGIGLTACVICYLILETPFIQSHRILFFIALTGSISVPVLFFLLTKAIFDDHFKPTCLILGWFTLEIVPHFWIYLRGVVIVNDTLLQITYIVSEIVSLGFVLAGLYVAVKTRKADLIESRLQFRNIFILVTAAIIGITLIVESLPIARESVDILQVVQRTSIILLTLFFLLSNVEIKSGFFFKEVPRSVINKKNQEYSIALHSQYQFVCAFSSFFNQENSRCSIQALEPTHLTVISDQLFQQLCQRHGCWNQFWLRVLANKTTDLIEQEKHLLGRQLIIRIRNNSKCNGRDKSVILFFVVYLET